MWTRSSVWLDANGARTIFRINTGAGLGTTAADLEALSNAGVLEYWESNVTALTPAPVAAAFQSGADRAALVFQCADGTQVTVIIPAPKAAIFMADTETVDPTNADVATFVTSAISAPITNAVGSAVTALVAGQRLPRAANPA